MVVEQAHLDEPTNEELRLIDRRSALKLLGGAGLAALAACAPGSVTGTTLSGSTPTTDAIPTTGAATTTGSPGSTFGGAGSCVLIPEETAGPFPLDLSGDEAFLRSAIAEDRPGVPLSLTLHLVDTDAGCRAIEGARVDVWHCDADGVYSGYSQQG
ncbi:MAG TPA: dioxygenase, partial [Acidimicrobiia bacterium]